MKIGVWLSVLAVVFVAGGFAVYFVSRDHGGPPLVSGVQDSAVGTEIARYKGVPAYQNGDKVTKSHGKHYAKNGYYYGQKWQCVEYVKRFYHDALSHKMPSVWGHARDFYDPEIANGEINPARGLMQYHNGGSDKPRPDDLVVFHDGSLGHVAIVTKVTKQSVVVIQQNVKGAPTGVFPLVYQNGTYTMGKDNQPAGWLRLP